MPGTYVGVFVDVCRVCVNKDVGCNKGVVYRRGVLTIIWEMGTNLSQCICREAGEVESRRLLCTPSELFVYHTFASAYTPSCFPFHILSSP